MKSIVLSIFTLLFVFTSNAQSQHDHEFCGYKTELERMMKRYPNYLVWQNALYQQAMSELMEMNSAKRTIVADTLYFEIPVVFHVLYNNASQNISDALILSQLKIMNDAFRKLNPDTQSIRSIFKPIAADVRIQFVIANRDPNGNATNGITRTSTNVSTFATNVWGAYSTNMKYGGSAGGKDAWDPTSYMNIWICNMQYPNGYSIVYGFATPPTNAPNWDGFTDATKDSTNVESGVVLHYKIVGLNNPQAPVGYTNGKTAVHEVGHFLGLRHVWGDGNNNTGCSVDDGIFDTPNAKLSNSLCSGQNTCNTGSGDFPDQTENYMDYALGCAAMFTKQQAFMMRYVLNTLRSGLPIRYIEYDTLPDNGVDVELKVYPNPLAQNDNLNLQIKGSNNQYFEVTIIDMSGKQIYNKSLISNTTHSIETSGMAQSVYYIIVRDSEGKMVGKEMLLLL